VHDDTGLIVQWFYAEEVSSVNNLIKQECTKIISGRIKNKIFVNYFTKEANYLLFLLFGISSSGRKLQASSLKPQAASCKINY